MKDKVKDRLNDKLDDAAEKNGKILNIKSQLDSYNYKKEQKQLEKANSEKNKYVLSTLEF